MSAARSIGGILDGGYDAGYRACPCFWGREPGSLVKLLARILPTLDELSVLDAGCGEGKNAAYLALRGARVRAVDVSQHAISNARSAWSEVEGISWEVGDIRTLETTQSGYEVVIAYGLLHCMRSERDIETVVENLKSSTKSGGHFVMCAFNDRSQNLSAHPGFVPCLAQHSFYTNLFSDWGHGSERC